MNVFLRQVFAIVFGISASICSLALVFGFLVPFARSVLMYGRSASPEPVAGNPFLGLILALMAYELFGLAVLFWPKRNEEQRRWSGIGFLAGVVAGRSTKGKQ